MSDETLTAQPVFFTPPLQRALRSDVYDALRRALVQGALKPGQRINEAELARQMQISRAPIREAIRQLEQEGLLESVPRRGTFVPALSREDVEEVYTLRADLEARAVRRAVPRLTTGELATLTDFVDKMCAAGEAKDLATVLEADIQFHRFLVEAAGWPRLRKLWEGLHPQTLTLYTLNTLTDWTSVDHARRHEPLLVAIRTGDPEVATAAIQEHILGVCAQVIRRLSISAASNPPLFPVSIP